MRGLVSIIGLCAALVLCAVSAAMNFLFLSSLGKSALEGQVLGAASAAADVLKALLPFYIAWSWQARRIVATVAGALAFAFLAAFSLMSAIGFAADNRGFLVGKRDELAGAYERMQRDLKALQSQRAGLPQSRPPSVALQEIERLRQNRRWSTTKSCANATEAESRDFCAGYFALRSELAAGNEAARLSFEIAALERQTETLRQQGSRQDADPQVTLLSRISGLSEEPVRLALIVAVALLVEIGASLGLFLASGHGSAVRKAAPEKSASAYEPENSARPAVGSVEDFCLEALLPAKGGVMDGQALLDAYQDWCATGALTPLSAAEFSAAFEALAKVVGLERVAGRYRGIVASGGEHRKAA